MDQAPQISNPEDKNKLYSEAEFIEKFNNFNLLFTKEEPKDLPVREFLKDYYPSQFATIKSKFNGIEALSFSHIIQNEKMLYALYKALRDEGEFSNEQLGLKS